jgi:thioredoxin 1
MILEVKVQNFEQEVLKSAQPVLVDFWGTNCKGCNIISPVLDRLSERYAGKFKFCKINVDDNIQTAAKYHIMSKPTLLFFKNGKAVDTAVGAQSESALKSIIDDLLR